MIIFGTKGVETVADNGEFFCPACRARSRYSLVRVKRYFTLYFIPLFPMGSVGEYVTCFGCGGNYDTMALERDASWVEPVDQPWECPACGNRNPGEHRECVRCRRWLCRNCGNDNPEATKECMRCRGLRGG